MGKVAIEHFKKARKFLNALRRSNKRWLESKSWDTPWVFRGQRDAKWDLSPSAWRENVFEKQEFNWFFEHYVVPDETVDRALNHLKQIRKLDSVTREAVVRTVTQNAFEYAVIQAFSDIADQLGFSIPGGSPPKYRVDSVFESYEQDEQPHPAFALAQHHGMPTRLLDWTHNPTFAAYFAAAEADAGKDGRVAVWALDVRALDTSNGYHTLSIPRSQIGFLHAQEGLFTYFDRSRGNLVCAFDGEWPQMNSEMPDGALRKLTLRNSETPELLRLLWSERISKAHLMPTHDNVTETLTSAWRRFVKSSN